MDPVAGGQHEPQSLTERYDDRIEGTCIKHRFGART